MGLLTTAGSFQVTLAAATVAQAVEKPNVEPGAGNPSFSSCIVRALKGNKGTLYLGGAGVSATTGIELGPGDSMALDIQGLGKVFMNGTETGDKLAVFWAGP